MELMTKHFGEVNIDEDKILNFGSGVPGFVGNKYIIMQENDGDVSEQPFVWLQSVEDPEIALVLANTFLFFKDYSPEIQDEQVASLEIEDSKDISVFNVVVIPDNIEDMTVNLKAPIIVNNKNLKAMQVIADNKDYDIRYKLYSHLKVLAER